MPPPPYSYKNSVKSDISDELVNVYVQRPLAGLITRAVYRTPIIPNHLTIAAIFFGTAGGLILGLSDSHLTAAALCLYAKDILDSADGQLARAKHLYSRRGRFLDSIGDFIVDAFLFGGIFFLLQRNGYSVQSAFAVSLIGFLGICMRVSYHVYYQTSFLHSQLEYRNNRVTEEFRGEDYEQDALTMRLQKIFLFLYGWQDRLIQRLDEWCLKEVMARRRSVPEEWYQDNNGLRLGGLLGFGTEFFALTVCLLLESIQSYLVYTLVIANGVWLTAILYRKFLLTGKILRKIPAGEI